MDILNNFYFKTVLTYFVLNSRSNINTVLGYLRTCKCFSVFSHKI